MPKKYKYTRAWFVKSEIKNNILKILNAKKQHRILEIGCYEGLSTVFFADQLLKHHKSTLICVDPFLTDNNNDHKSLLQNNQESNFNYNIKHCDYPKKITFYKKTSDDFFKTNKNTFNFIYIDGSHEVEYIKRDMENSFNVLEQNGIMWMDDYLHENPQIKICMDDFIENHKDQCKIIHSNYQLAIQKN